MLVYYPYFVISIYLYTILIVVAQRPFDRIIIIILCTCSTRAFYRRYNNLSDSNFAQLCDKFNIVSYKRKEN